MPLSPRYVMRDIVTSHFRSGLVLAWWVLYATVDRFCRNLFPVQSGSAARWAGCDKRKPIRCRGPCCLSFEGEWRLTLNGQVHKHADGRLCPFIPPGSDWTARNSSKLPTVRFTGSRQGPMKRSRSVDTARRRSSANENDVELWSCHDTNGCWSTRGLCDTQTCATTWHVEYRQLSA